MNRLAQEKSPYLLQHAQNPVDWFPWGEEAFAKARKEDKPIFLSIGYSTCHWCHVMAHESFENTRTAAVMNDLFVNVKLDREERPDVDRVYMTFVQATTGSGGWPMSVWLQPDLKPIVGGTYFPPDDRYGRRGFVSICQAVAHAWKTEREKVVSQGERITAALREHIRSESAGSAAEKCPPAEDILRKAGDVLSAQFDSEWGGFGQAPKFPRPVTLMLLTQLRSPQADKMLLATLDKMAAGGMYDHLGGGFHRYSVDRYWHVPHFEKMLYDQAQLTVAYLDACRLTGSPRYASIARDTLAYVRRDLLSPGGGFYCAEDADSLLAADRPEHAEGAFYVWTQAEIESALSPEESAAFCRRYGVSPHGNAPAESDPHGEFRDKNVLFVHDAAAVGDPALSSARRKLFDLRAKRPRPHLDDKIVTAWNGLMITAYARAYQQLEHPEDLATAQRAADFIRHHLFREGDGALLRSYRQGPSQIEGFADDYAFLIQGLLDLYETDFNADHLLWAERLQNKQDELFYDARSGGYFASSERDPNVLLRMKEDHDGAEPGASSVSVLNLLRLAALLDRDDLRQRASTTAAFFGAWQDPARAAQVMPLMLASFVPLARPLKQIVIAGKPDADDTRALLRVVYRHTPFERVLLFADSPLSKRLPYLADIITTSGRATAYLCEHGACRLPTTDPAALAQLF